MVQPYQRAVDDVGEVGLIFLGGTFSHAMHKDPMIRRGTGPGPSLIENQVVTPASPSAAQLALGHAAVAAAERLHGPTSYARVDTVEGDDGRPLLLELELLDPALFFVTDPGGAERFAGVLARRARLLPPPRPGSATGVTGRAAAQPCVSATAASGSTTRKLKLSSRYSRTTDASWSL